VSRQSRVIVEAEAAWAAFEASRDRRPAPKPEPRRWFKLTPEQGLVYQTEVRAYVARNGNRPNRSIRYRMQRDIVTAAAFPDNNTPDQETP
jgi:hypothetical protein